MDNNNNSEESKQQQQQQEEIMFKNASLLSKIVAVSVAASKKAGKIIQGTLGSDLEIIQKSNVNDLQTIADRRAQHCIIGTLRKKFGHGLAIIGEEEEENFPGDNDSLENGFDSSVIEKCSKELASVKENDIVVWVDPLDGTSEFTQGLLDHVTVLIGIAVEGRAFAGVVHQPFYGFDNKSIKPENWGRTIWAVKGSGVHGIKASLPPQGQRIITTTRSHSDKNVAASVEALKPDKVLRVGGAGHKVMLLMEGKAHAYVFASSGCKKWDTCAPEAVLSCLGGKLTDMFGDQIMYYKEVEKPNSLGVLATAPSVDHQWYVDRIPVEVKEYFS